MRQAIADTRRLSQTATVVPLPAPVGGWNTSDSFANMPPLDAIVMDNFTPEDNSVDLRKGDESFATNMSGNVETLAEYVGATANKLLAASDGNIYDITAGGVIGSTLGTGFTNARWQTANYNTFMFWANGADTLQRYDGTTLANSTFTGVTLADIINVSVVKNRVWLVEKDSGSAWYGAAAAVTGALTEFNVGEVARSGYLVTVESWSQDAGDGMNDFTVFIMSTGQCLVYQGDVSTTFTLEGKFDAPPPIGRRCAVNLGGELIVITSGGYFTMSNIMAGQIRPEDALSSKIRKAAKEAYTLGSSFNGWDVLVTPDQGNVIVNVPIATNEFVQHVFSTVSKGWGRWLSQDTFSLGTLNDDLYGGHNGGEVYKMETGTVDASRSNANIEGYVVQAFNAFEEATQRNKQVTAVKPFVSGSGQIDCTFAVWPDYRVGTLAANLQQLNPGGQPWEEYTTINWENWDLLWGSDQGGVSTINLSANVIGDTFAVACALDTDESFQWFETNLTIKPGGIV